VIEMNPRSLDSAASSNRRQGSIAKITGRSSRSVTRSMRSRTTSPAHWPPSTRLDYVVTKIPRFAFKVPGPQRHSLLLNAQRGLEVMATMVRKGTGMAWFPGEPQDIRKRLDKARTRYRIFAGLDALRGRLGHREICDLVGGAGSWWHLVEIVAAEGSGRDAAGAQAVSPAGGTKADVDRVGNSLWRPAPGLQSHRLTCARSSGADPLLLLTYEVEDEVIPRREPSVVVPLGSWSHQGRV